MDQKKRIVHIERSVPTCSRTDDGCPQYQPNENALYVLERGEIIFHGKPGDSYPSEVMKVISGSA